MDLNSFSREQLIALLEKKNNNEMLKSQGISPSEEIVEICQFRPIKGNQPPCDLESSTLYGFCKKHSRTVQAKRAKHAWGETHAPLEQNQEPPVPTPAPTPAPTPVPTPASAPTRVLVPVPNRHPFIKEKPPIDKLAEQLGNMEKRILQRTQPVEKKPNKASLTSIVQPPNPYPPKARTPPSQKVVSAKRMPKSSQAKVKRVPPVKEKRKVQTKTKPEPPKTKKIKPNIWGRYEDLDTHILFDPKTKQAFGVQNRNGTISALGKKHINICKRHGWNYKMPRGYNYSESDDEKEPESSDDESESDNDSDDTEPSVTDGDLSETYLDSESEEKSSDEESEEESEESEEDSDNYDESDDDSEDDYY